MNSVHSRLITVVNKRHGHKSKVDGADQHLRLSDSLFHFLLLLSPHPSPPFSHLLLPPPALSSNHLKVSKRKVPASTTSDTIFCFPQILGQ